MENHEKLYKFIFSKFKKWHDIKLGCPQSAEENFKLNSSLKETPNAVKYSPQANLTSVIVSVVILARWVGHFQDRVQSCILCSEL